MSNVCVCAYFICVNGIVVSCPVFMFVCVCVYLSSVCVSVSKVVQ